MQPVNRVIDSISTSFDIVSIYTLPGFEKQKTVKVEGEVIYPGSYTIKSKNEKISDLVARAGGLTASADVEGGSLRRDNIAILGIDSISRAQFYRHMPLTLKFMKDASVLKKQNKLKKVT